MGNIFSKVFSLCFSVLILLAFHMSAVDIALAAPGTATGATKGIKKAKKTKAGKKRALNVYVVGDSLADGVWHAIRDDFKGKRRFKIIRNSKASTGLSRPDYFNWFKRARKIVRKKHIDAVVVMIGINDGLYIKNGKRMHRFHTNIGYSIYKKRLNKFMKIFSDKKIPIYWYELPVMRKAKLNRSVNKINQFVYANANKHNVTIIKTDRQFRGKNGRYSSYGKNWRGKTKKLRTNDGIHFTRHGYANLSRLVFNKLNELTVEKPQPVFVKKAPPLKAGFSVSFRDIFVNNITKEDCSVDNTCGNIFSGQFSDDDKVKISFPTVLEEEIKKPERKTEKKIKPKSLDRKPVKKNVEKPASRPANRPRVARIEPLDKRLTATSFMKKHLAISGGCPSQSPHERPEVKTEFNPLIRQKFRPFYWPRNINSKSFT